MKPLLIAIVLLATPGLAVASAESMTPSHTDIGQTDLEVVAEMMQGPGNITVTPAGETIVSLHQFFNHDIRVASVNDNGSLAEFAAAANLDSVLGLQADSAGVVWLLDNAMRNDSTRRLVGWHTGDDRVVADIDLTNATTGPSFLNDLAVDPERQTAYLADPAGGADAAIIVVNLALGTARRVLQGHKSVTPGDRDLVIDGTPVRILTDDGSEIRPRVGINPIAIDSRGEWLYYGPMHGHSMYRIRTADLRDAELAPAELAARVERWARKQSVMVSPSMTRATCILAISPTTPLA
jgi:sugar lactone lactonase YvrE